MTDVKNTLEVLDLLPKMASAIVMAKADGSIDWRDLGKVGPVVAQLRAAVTDGKLIPMELQDLDAAEIDLLVSKLIDGVRALVSAFITP